MLDPITLQYTQNLKNRTEISNIETKDERIRGGGGGKSSGVQPPRATLRAKRVRELSDLQAD